MLRTFTDTKAMMLGAAIILGVMAECSQAKAAGTETLVVAGGCFWCVESDFEKVPGVVEVTSGYAGGSTKNPTYKDVSRGNTGHLEVAAIEFDPSEVSRAEILDKFLRSVDVFDDGGQFCDRGFHYTTAIFADSTQRADAEAAVARAEAALGRQIVTPIRDPAPFYAAEDYHQDYYKSQTRVLTRFGAKTKAEAYKRYRSACGRDKRVRAIWGAAAPFAGS
ncbi:peptide-methionine (S)-S-oxide reductase MsrA [Tropicimonas sp. S265A]|uniref:peptide-methionine (S)-S-oxide reductase MsrA n=1 Tax=Tropicimonas sp. S265A TaxID=3415134 RepID=UPI003C7A072D